MTESGSACVFAPDVKEGGVHVAGGDDAGETV